MTTVQSNSSTRRAELTARVRAIAARVADPEIPVISIEDLGVLRDVNIAVDGHITVALTPTYSGCPALAEMAADVRHELAAEGFADVEITTVLSPAWNTDMITPAGRRALHSYGIAPPGPRGRGRAPVSLSLTSCPPSAACPQCGSSDTREISRFGSTACKALYRCVTCQEPFDYFKVL